MKNIIKISVSLLSLLIPLTFLTSCNKENDNTSEDNNKKPTSFQDFDLSGFSSNITNASSIGIYSKETKPIANLANNNDLIVDKNTIVMNTFGNDNGELKQMEFTKYISNPNNEMITEYREILATKDETRDDLINGSITFMVTEGFNYALYLNKDDETPITGLESIQDGFPLDRNDKAEFVTVDDLLENTTYYLQIRGNGKIINIEQEDIDVEIDKLYSTSGFTFVSFVPKGTSKRSSQIYYDNFNHYEENILQYDKYDYYSNNYDRKSYVIDNKTGLIYFINTFKIYQFENGLLDIDLENISGPTIHEEKEPIHKMKLYDYRINDKNEFELIQLYDNDSIIVEFGFKDKYNNKYIMCNINYYDKINNATFFKEESKYDYYLTSNGKTARVIHKDDLIDEIKLKNNEGEFVDLPKKGKFDFVNDTLIYDVFGVCKPFKYIDGELYYTNVVSNYNASLHGIHFGILNVFTKENIVCLDGSYIMQKKPVVNSQWSANAVPLYLSDGFMILHTGSKLYYVDNIFEKLRETVKNPKVNNFEWNCILSNCTLDFEESIQRNVIRQKSFNDDINYEIFLEDEGDRKVLKLYEFNTNIRPMKLTILPINK